MFSEIRHLHDLFLVAGQGAWMGAIETPTGERPRLKSSTPDSHFAVKTKLDENTLANDTRVLNQATLARNIPRVMGMTQTVSPGPEPAIIRIACRVANCNLRSP